MNTQLMHSILDPVLVIISPVSGLDEEKRQVYMSWKIYVTCSKDMTELNLYYNHYKSVQLDLIEQK